MPADPARPDPATRDLLKEAQARPGVATHLAVHGQPREANVARDALAAHAQHLWDLVEENPFAQLGLQDAARRAEKAAAGYATAVPPPLPDEPPDGTVLRGNGTDVWQRRDDPVDIRDNLEGPRWARAGDHVEWTWYEAYERGADPGRRLVELPGPDCPDDDPVLVLIEDTIDANDDRFSSTQAREIVRALAERRNQ